MLSGAQKVHQWIRRFAVTAFNVRAPSADTAYNSRADWSISLFPDGHAFGFTIVHDADSAYSRRLEPLFEVFDEFGFKISVTAFVFWADWAENGAVWRVWREAEAQGCEFFAPRCVPLLDDQEREFYKNLSASGHEIGMHTPSDTSNVRQDVIRAFELFKKIFGRYPTLYAEHRVSTKKDAQANEGSKAESLYYNTDLLNSYGPWVWIDDASGVPHNRHPQFYDILAVNGSPFNALAAQQYGIEKAFLRTGKWREGDGDGFLAWYSEEHIDALERDRGLALVYTHLDKKWLDLHTRRMRTAIKDRLRYLASKDGWFVPAGTILDRLRAVQKLKMYHGRQFLTIVNTSAEKIEGLTILSHKRRSLSWDNEVLSPSSRGEIVVGSINPGETRLFNIVQPLSSSL